MSEALLTGACLCGAVSFALTEPPAPDAANYCHCTRCQRRTGTGSSANVAIDGATLRLRSGEDRLRWWRPPGGGHLKGFCAECGGHVFSRHPEDPRRMAVRLGAFDGDPGVRPSVRQFTAYAAPWEPIPDDGLERFPESRSA